MALIVKDRIKETTATTGTGTVTLAGAEDGFQAFSVVGDANTTYYAIVSGDNWEVGYGTYTLSGTTLSRTTILESSNSGSAITLAGTSDVFCTYPAEKALLLNASNQINDADVVVTANILDDAVTTAKILDSNVTTGKIADDAVTTDKLANSINIEITANTAKVTNATHTGDVTGATALTIGNDKVITAKILDANVTDAKINTMSSSKLTGALPAIDGSALTGLSGGLEWQSSIVTASTLTAVAGKGYWINTTSNTCTITLPASASVGDQLVFTDYAGTWTTNKIIIDSNGLNYQGAPDTTIVQYNIDGQSVDIVYSGATQGWIPNSDQVTEDFVPAYDVDFLIVAGGAGGGGYGGGGAGGYRTSTQTIATGRTTTVTALVGDGGTATVSGNGGMGSASSISGTGLTTISSAGNTPSTSPVQGYAGGAGGAGTSPLCGGGGGGASAVGAAGSSPNAGNGGAGTASSITGASVTYAGGGGGAVNVTGTIGTGGVGGGGSGGQNTLATNATSGTVNTGGGGGASADMAVVGLGGKGVVILSMPTNRYSGTTTGFPTVTTSGANTILTFTGTGTYSG